MPRRHLSAVEVARIIALLQQGFSMRYVAQDIGASVSVVSRAWLRYQDTGNYTRREGSGRSRLTTNRQDRAIVRYALERRIITARNIRNDIHLRHVCEQTIRNRLREAGLRPRVRAQVPRLTLVHRQVRYQFARDHINWTARDWRNVYFSDESRFCLYGNDARIRTWRRRNERYDRRCVMPIRSYNGGSVMVWGCISLTRRSDLVILPPPAMTGVRYINDILRPHVLLLNRTCRNFIFMQDNARPHTANITRRFFQRHAIRLLNHPANSPDLNPIEHIWDEMERRLRRREEQPRNLEELGEILMEIWHNIPQDRIARCINMRERLQAVIDQRGGNTHY